MSVSVSCALTTVQVLKALQINQQFIIYVNVLLLTHQMSTFYQLLVEWSEWVGGWSLGLYRRTLVGFHGSGCFRDIYRVLMENVHVFL